MLNPPHPIARRGYITYPHGHSLWLLRLVTKYCEDFKESQTTFINAFMSPLFNAVGASGKGCCKPLRLQRYNIFLIYTNKNQKNRLEERFFVCTMYDVQFMYYLVLGTIYNRMTLDKIKYQMSIVNYQFSKCHRFAS